jgi:hypothetical protein
MGVSMTEWAIAGESLDTAVVVEAPARPEGWEEAVWVRVRPLTDREALERESLGLREEYELVSEGLAEATVRVQRRYDLAAMAAYDVEHSIVDFCLPEVAANGQIEERRYEALDPAGMVELIGRMQPALSAWVWSVVDEVNWRTPQQRAILEMAKKN